MMALLDNLVTTAPCFQPMTHGREEILGCHHSTACSILDTSAGVYHVRINGAAAAWQAFPVVDPAAVGGIGAFGVLASNAPLQNPHVHRMDNLQVPLPVGPAARLFRL